jgi:apolipoprotein N-acyltransferase
VGIIKTLLVLGWYWDVDPQYAYDVTNTSLFYWVLGFAWLYSSLAVAAGWGLLTGLVWWCKNTRFAWALVPTVLTVAEVAGSLSFGLLSASPRWEMNSWFSFGYAGYALASHNFIGQLAHWGGVYTLSWLLYATATVIVLYWRKGWFQSPRRQMVLVAILIVLVVSAPLSPSQTDTGGESITVFSVNTRFKNHERLSLSRKVEESRQLVEALKVVTPRNPDYIIFPEAADAFRIVGNSAAVTKFISDLGVARPIIVDSDLRSSGPQEMQIRSVMIDTARGESVERYKRYLVPNGEFVSAVIYYGLLGLGRGEVAEKLDNRLIYRPYRLPQPPFTDPMWPGVLFCSESMSPVGVARAQFGSAVPFIAHLSSHAWFTEPRALWYQLDLMLKTQVRMAGVPLIEAVNNGLPRAYDARGFALMGETIYATPEVEVIQYRVQTKKP